MHIRRKFLSLIEAGNKKREYRLNNPERQEIETGDILILIASEDDSVVLKTKVLGKEAYGSWDEILAKHWEDFSAAFETKNEALEECSSFYRTEDIGKYGLVGFELEVMQ